MRRPGRRAAAGAAAGVVAGVLAGARHAYRSTLPRHDAGAMVPGLAGRVEIVRDVDGVPHVRADSEPDALAGLGYCHAQDRLWQMELVRRLVRGTLAELAGRAALPTDRYVRTLGLARVAEAEAAALAGGDLAAVEGYCRGINAWLDADRFRLPLELRLLRHRPAPWTPADALLAIRLFALGLGQNWEGEIVRARLATRLGAARLERLEPGYPADGYTSLPASAAEAVRAALAAKARAGGTEGAGSNNWVLAADRTTTGAPLLANDPHLLLGAPCVWYAADLAFGDERVAGLTTPGLPGVVIGQTAHAAWSFTNVEADTQDLVAVAADEIEERSEEIRVRGRRGRELLVIGETRHGPVVTPLAPGETTAYALQWTALAPAGSVAALRALARARTADDVVAGLGHFGGPTLNAVYALADGTIGYQLCGGPVPVRDGHDGRLPTDRPWSGTVPYDELPAWRDPPGGAIVTANNRIVGDDYPHLIATEWLNPYRAERIAALLAGRERHAVEDLVAIQADTYSLPHVRLRDLVAGVAGGSPLERAALAELAAWDGRMDAGSSGAAVAGTLLRHLLLEAFAEVGDELARFLGDEGFSELSPMLEFYNRGVPVVLDALAARDDGFFRDGRTWNGVVAKCLVRSCVELEQRAGSDPARWSWGAVHRLVLDHPLATIPGLDRVLRRGPHPLPGDADTVRAAGQPVTDPFAGTRTSGAGMRLVASLADPDDSRLVLCGGQSGHPASAAYDDQVDDWLAGRSRRLRWSPGAIAAGAVATAILEPGR